MRCFKYIVLTLVAFLGFISCQQKDLFLHETNGNLPVNVVIHWDSVPADQLVLPSNMIVHWYPEAGNIISSEMGPYGGREWLYGADYNVMCMDFKGNANFSFRSNGTRPDFEVYNVRMTGSYNLSVPQLPGGEVTVAEANPPYFYIDSRPQHIHVDDFLNNDMLSVHFYPKNVLREFTFLIYDVTGTQNIANNSGAISGMSGSYYPATGALATTPSTILFPRVEMITNAQNNRRWTDEERTLFAAKNPDWASSDTLVGWTRDWITGKFSTFGPLDRDENRFRLTIEAFSKGSNTYYGAWGYWHGQWENTVAAQIDSAMGKNGTIEEQLDWRQRNGGYDIILYNNNRLSVPHDYGGGGQDGGFDVSVDDWGDIIDVPLAGSPSPTSAGVALRSKVNTKETLSDFVVSGAWTDGSDWDLLFNAQNIYKPEHPDNIWDYSPKKYWPQGGDVDFYAYAPASVITNLRTGLYYTGSTLMPPPVLTYAMPLKDDGETPPPGTGEPSSTPIVDEPQEDLLVAVQSRPSPHNAEVPIYFQHAFSRVSVKVKLRDVDFANGYRIKVTRVDLRSLKTKGELELKKDVGTTFSNGIPSGEGSFTKFKYNGTNNVILWTNLDSLANYRFKLLSPDAIIDDDYTALVHSDDGVFVMPQLVGSNNTAVYVEYDIYTYTVTEGERYVSSATKRFPLNTNFAFEIGRSYALLLELKVE